MKAFEWQGGTDRGDRPYFGQSASLYDEVRPGYDETLVTAILNYAGRPNWAVEIGAGTGKATAAFCRLGVHVVCIEPDPAMSTMIKQRFSSSEAQVATCLFETWDPPAAPPLVYCAQAWHWIDPSVRCVRAARVLGPGGTLALFGHRFLIADPDVEARVDEVYRTLAPELLGNPALRRLPASKYWYADDLRRSNAFTNVVALDMGLVVSYEIDAYLRLVSSFSSHRQLDPLVLKVLVDRVRRAIDGDFVDVDLATVLTLGRADAGGHQSCGWQNARIY